MVQIMVLTMFGLQKDGSVTILSDSKQIKNGTVSLNPNGAGGNTQLSSDWIAAVMRKLPDSDPTKIAVEQARIAGKLKQQ